MTTNAHVTLRICYIMGDYWMKLVWTSAQNGKRYRYKRWACWRRRCHWTRCLFRCDFFYSFHLFILFLSLYLYWTASSLVSYRIAWNNMEGIRVEKSVNASDLTECGRSRVSCHILKHSHEQLQPIHETASTNGKNIVNRCWQQ